MRMLWIALAAAVSTLSQQTFRTSTSTVEIYATVVDRSGRLIPDLTRDDFVVRDNGTVRPISVFAQGTQPITMALMMDESPSVAGAFDRIAGGVQELSRHFIPGDRAALGAFSHLVRLDPTLSSDPASLVPGLFAGRPRFPAGTALWDGLDAARDALRSESGRRVVLVLTDADDNCSLIDPREVIARIERESTMVYAIGVRGNQGLPVRELRALTQSSGGYYFELRSGDDLAATFARVADELHRQYVIGFVPQQLDGTRHTIEIETRRSGLTVRARRSFVAAAPGRERE
jgi:VWFA-related protein